MTFGAPLVALAAGLAAVLFACAAALGARRARGGALAYSQLAFLEANAGRTPWNLLFTGAFAFALALVGIAFARPSVVAPVATRDASVVLCIDTSGSMASSDVEPTRAAAAASAAEAFIDGVPEGTRVGLVAFSTSAIPLGAPSDDRDQVKTQLLRIPPPNGGTAIGDALAAAAELLPRGGRRAIVLVTDGVNNHGRDPLEAAQLVGASGIAIFTVGIGTNDSGELIPGTSERASIDEEALRAIAASGHGTYARVADAAALRDRLATLAATTVRERHRIDLAFPFAVGGAALAIVTAGVAFVLGRFP